MTAMYRRQADIRKIAFLEIESRVARWVILQASEDGVTKPLVEWERLKTEGVHMCMFASAKPGFVFGGEHQLSPETLPAKGLRYHEILDSQPVPVRHPDESRDSLAVVTCQNRQIASGGRSGLSLVEAHEASKNEFRVFRGRALLSLDFDGHLHELTVSIPARQPRARGARNLFAEHGIGAGILFTEASGRTE